MTVLYKRDSKANVRVWKIWVDGVNNSICSEAGLLDGALIPTETIIHEGLGGKTPYEQATFDMQSEINKKIRAGYVKELKDLKPSGFTATIAKPSKGNVYDPTGKKDKSYTLVKAKYNGRRIGIGTKLDGWRYRIWTDGDECIFYSSSGKIVLGFPQVEQDILKLFPTFSDQFGYGSIILDGEMYNHELGGQRSASACGTSYRTEDRDKMQFHIFDMVIEDLPYIERYAAIQTFWKGDSIIPWQMDIIEADEKVIDTIFESFLKCGYEGAILRDLSALYAYKKNNQFLKYKPLLDSEHRIVGANKSITGNTLGSLILALDDGRTFSSDLKGEIGSDEFKQKLWDDIDDFIGKYVTVEYLNLTEDGIPRHPRAKCFRKGKSID